MAQGIKGEIQILEISCHRGENLYLTKISMGIWVSVLSYIFGGGMKLNAVFDCFLAFLPS